MNHILEKTARRYLRDNLRLLPMDNQETFKLMYGCEGGRSVTAALAADIGETVDKMPVVKLDWAMMQVEQSLKQNQKKG